MLAATNAWLYSQTRNSHFRYDQDRGYVCTFTGLVLKGTKAHVFHVGDARLYRLQGSALERLTEEHRIRLSEEKSYLSRALGVAPHVEIDYRSLELEDRYYVGFHFVEAGVPLGEELLEEVVKKAGRGKLGKMAKNKLKLAGLSE